MSEELRQLIDEATKLELNVAEVYIDFYHKFHEDAGFWKKMALEERNHAALLENGKRLFLDAGMFPRELVGESLKALINANNELGDILKQCKQATPSRAVAFNLALKLENLAGEIHFQHAMQQANHPSEAIKIFQSLNENDRDHADRIRQYMHQNGIEITCN